MKRKIFTLALSFAALLGHAQAPKTPAMGWSSWNNYRIHINHEIICKQADAMVSSGMKAVGYQFVNIDDGYFGGRQADGTLYCDSTKFPHGMKAVADHVKKHGLKPGIYSEAGTNTCGSIWDKDKNGFGVGLWNHDKQDLDLFFNKWGYEFLKVDWCGGEKQKLDEATRYAEIIEQVRATKKGIVFNICRWRFPGTWALPIADSWRISGDIGPTFKSISHIIEKNAYLAAYAGPGHYNDMDMLQIGRGMTKAEDEAHFTMWCMMASPLMAGNDLAAMSEETRVILTNKEVIAINQDKAGIQAERVENANGVQLWVKPLGDRMSKSRAVAVLNTTDKSVTYSIDWEKVGLAGTVKTRDLWKHMNMKPSNGKLEVEVPSHGVVVLKAEGAKAITPVKYEAEYAFLNGYMVKGMATYKKNDNASGKMVATNIGGKASNWIEFPHVYVEKTGDYQFTLPIDNMDGVVVRVNGKLVRDISPLRTGKTMDITLKKGYNAIRINSSSNIPEIDYIEVK
ncbi:alpha-galactosidase [Prolixibacteraceae bacterium JC049]|nr:alpha-galactosidase [Prolixibacteraceae bacterium JC049]